jgi:putative tricarboxylic transport membrane protein
MIDTTTGTVRRHGIGLGELAMVLGLAALGVFVLIETPTIRVPGSTNTIGPRFFPYLVGGLLVVTAVALAVQVLRGRAAPPEDSEDVDSAAGTDWRAVALVVAGFAGHALLIEPVGWPIAATVLFAVVAFALGGRRPVRTVAIGLALSVVVWLVFVLGLEVALPGGPLEWVVFGP